MKKSPILTRWVAALILCPVLFNACDYEISPKAPESFPSANARPLPLNVGYISMPVRKNILGRVFVLPSFSEKQMNTFGTTLQSAGLFGKVKEIHPLDGKSNFDILIKLYSLRSQFNNSIPSVFTFFPLCDPLIIGCGIYWNYPNAYSQTIAAVVSRPSGQTLKTYTESISITASLQTFAAGYWENSAAQSAVANLAAKITGDMIRDRDFFRSLVPGDRGSETSPDLAQAHTRYGGSDSGLNHNNEGPVSVNTPNYSEPVHSDDFAVVVGVEKYAEDLPPAEFATNDAKAVFKHLRALGVPARHIVFLSNDRAGRSELVKNIERWLPMNVKPDSHVYFYFSGHGAPDPQTGEAYLVGFDGDPSDLADTAYPLSRLYAHLSRLKAKKVIAMLDSCFSGAGGRSVIAKGARPLVNQIKEGTVSPTGKLLVLTASKADQISGVLEDKRHGAFTYYLLKGLNGAALNADDHVTLHSLYGYLKPQVEDAAHLDSRNQDPQLLPRDSSSDNLKLR